MMNDQLTACTEYLLSRFNYEARMAEVSEQLSLNADAIDEALARFMSGDALTLRLAMENAARAICERAAQRLIKVHGDAWLELYERDEFEW